MKKLLAMVLVVFVLFALVACSGNDSAEVDSEPEQVQNGRGDQVTPPTATPQQPESTNVPEAPATTGTSGGNPGFNDTVVLTMNANTVPPESRGDLLEITFSPDITFVTADFERARATGIYEIDYGDVFVRIPVTVRNLYFDDFAKVGRLGQLLQFDVGNPDGSSVGSRFQNSIHNAMGEDNIHAYQTIADGETIHTYIYLSYYGEGEYTLNFLVAAVSNNRLRFTLDIGSR